MAIKTKTIDPEAVRAGLCADPPGEVLAAGRFDAPDCIPYLSDDDLRRFFRAVESNPRRLLRARDLALFSLMLAYGLRCNEASSLRLADLNLETGQVFVRRLKKSRRDRPTSKPKERSRVYDLSERNVALVKAWMKERAKVRLSDANPFLFVSAYSGREGHLSGDQIYHVARRYGERAGLRVHPHMFRHTTAVMMARAGMNAFAIQKRLGHSSPDSTAVYVAMFGPERAAEDAKAEEALKF